MPEEIWLTIENHPSYEISNRGNIRRAVNKRIKNLKVSRKGYLQCSISGPKSKKVTLYPHKLVTNAFMGPCPDGYVRNHIDGNKLNNAVENLEYVTQRENSAHWRKNPHHGAILCKKTGVWRAQTKIDGKMVYIGRYPTQEEAGQAYKDFLLSAGITNKYAGVGHG